jgi:NADH:ubiquinone oxidoreductase subunit 3 (subunit A)
MLPVSRAKPGRLYPAGEWPPVSPTQSAHFINSTRMKSAPVRFALAALVLSLIWILFEHLMGWNTKRHDIGQYTRLVPMLVFWIILVSGIWYVRRHHGHSLTFREGFQAGLIMTLIYCAGFTIIMVLYQKFMNPDYYQTMKEFTLQGLRERRATQHEIEEAEQQLYHRAGGSARSYLLLFVYSSIWGVGISSIASMMLRKGPH